jgi:fatty-acyl-CoA synthase
VRDGLPSLREVISLADWDGFAGSGSPTERLPQVGPDDEAQIQYTSGTFVLREQFTSGQVPASG